VCIANWNCSALLRACLASLIFKNQGVRVEVIAVDNGSSDGAADMVAREFPEVILIRNDQNVGFARASNQAAARAQGRFLFFLNNDTLIPPGTLHRLVEHAEAHPEVAVLGPAMRDGEGQLQVSFRRLPTLATFLHRTCLFRWTNLLRPSYRNYRRQEIDTDAPRPVEVVMGAAMFMPRRLFHQLGRWDEEFFFGGEDLELCARFGRQHAIVYHPGIEITHLGRASTRLNIGFASTQIAVGFIRYLRKAGYRDSALLLYKLVCTLDAPLHALVKSLQYLWRRLQGRREKADKSLLVVRSLTHFLTRGLIPFWKA
jgi:GT2 family glycosyltransferase